MSGKVDRNSMIKGFSLLGEAMVSWGKNSGKNEIHPFIAEPFHDKMNELIAREHHFNGWFTEKAIRESLLHLGEHLSENTLGKWLAPYPMASKPRRVGLILAGNIPLVGFHDVMSTLLSGHQAVIKMSSDDRRLLPLLLDVLVELVPPLSVNIKLVEKLTDIDAVIATGSDNSARYFEKYFGHLPNIIRKNRTSIAVLEGDETAKELSELGKDIFTYFGLGCRNVSHLMVPKSFDLDRFFGAIVEYGDIINHNKYANNYDYYKAIYLMNRESIIENGFVLTRESDELFAPIAVLHYQRYNSKAEVASYLKRHENKIQVVAGKAYTPFGQAQSPELNDYADGIDTLEFLSEL